LAANNRSYTGSQLLYETVSRWNGGSYHEWDSSQGWIRRKDILCDTRTGNIGWNITRPNNIGRSEDQPRARDPFVLAAAGVEVHVIAEIDSALIVTDSYDSKGAGSFCQAGEETFLRVIGMHYQHPRETLRIKLASCWENTELEDSGLVWSADTSTLRVRWRFGPTMRNKPEELTLHFPPD
jgi:hypothetical protein